MSLVGPYYNSGLGNPLRIQTMGSALLKLPVRSPEKDDLACAFMIT